MQKCLFLTGNCHFTRDELWREYSSVYCKLIKLNSVACEQYWYISQDSTFLCSLDAETKIIITNSQRSVQRLSSGGFELDPH